MNKYTIATIFSILLISTPPFINVNLWSPAMQHQVVTESREFTLEIQILNMSIQGYQLKRVTLFLNGTKEIHVSICINSAPGSGLRAMPGKPLLRVNGTKVIHPQTEQTIAVNEDEPKLSNMKYSNIQQSPTYVHTIPNPVPPPDVPPPPVDYFLYDGVYFLYAKTYYPDGEDPFRIKYEQPDNWYSYWPRDWWRGWSFMVTKIFEHIPKDLIEDIIDGIEDMSALITSVITYAGAAITLGGGILAFYAAKMTAAGIILSWAPPLALALVALGVLLVVVSEMYESEGYSDTEWLQEVVQTDVGDGFCFWDIREGSDLFWVKIPRGFRYPPNNGPKTIVYCMGERNYYVSWGSELQEGKWTYYTTEWCYHSMTINAVPLPSLVKPWSGCWITGP